MRILNVNPSEVYSFVRLRDEINKNSIMVGKCHEDLDIKSNLVFQPILINQNEVLVKATLKMCCKRVCGSYDLINIHINKANVGMAVFGTGYYEWDVTKLIKFDCKFHLCAYTNDQMKCCSIREFEASDLPSLPILELIFEDVPSKPDYKMTDIIEECISIETIEHSEWIDCTQFNEYYYFIQNFGGSNVEIYIELSPDKHMIFKDAGPYILESQEVFYKEPIRNSKYLRIGYKNTLSCTPNKIKLWFQGKS